ncbi:hypothetical protein SAY86_000654 [Trapa natans]|uniref:Uncharacterized protein n=1 Tax=Trapa natans TaxID=22666 RepID=A0AAN7MFC1_TRANT|nr:hypothetical protein SAY86_000654 [Trapa natans]
MTWSRSNEELHNILRQEHDRKDKPSIYPMGENLWAEVLYTARQKARRETDHKITTTRSCWQLQPLKPTRKPFKAVELIALHLSQLHPSTCLSTPSRKKMKKKPRDSPHLIPLLIDLNSLCSIIKCDS